MRHARFIIATLVALLFVTVSPLSVYAQSQSLLWKKGFAEQTGKLLKSADPVVHGQALQLFILMADETNGELNLEPAADALINTYRTSLNDAHRMMAVVALSKIDNPDAYLSLLQDAQHEDAASIRRAILHAASTSLSLEDPRVATAFNALLDQQRVRLLALMIR